MNAVRQVPALLVSAPASGQGKTSFTAALARAHARRGRRVRVFKTGPDFLDPMVLERASGAPVYQLDLWMCGEADVRARLYEAAGEADLILVEGVMGLFDGGTSSADLSQRFGLPVLAVIDGSAMAQTFGAVATGLARYREGLQVYGVAANRIGGAYHAKLLAGSLPPELRWFGALPRDPALALPERHLGLVAAGELADLDARLDALADAMELHAGPDLPPPVAFSAVEATQVPRLLEGRRIAIARDDAFCFLYPANLDVLRQAGAELCWFSPLAGDALPDCDAAWLPGGYPELHLARLAERKDLHAALRAHVDAGKPLLAECGGMLSLLDALATRESDAHTMAGLLPGWAVVRERLAELGMQSVELPEGTLRGHTFHYAHAEITQPPLVHASNPDGGPAKEAVYRRARLTASFVHLYFPSATEAALRLFLP
ncbi:cobyrinic acid a,c-diamide synthase [Dyella sp. SG562]|uniref:cobyrinate a,c-diamide synthase n=1 Tax=Dyella sp. SG562 TaxID=2587017 RepID=UPI0031B7FDE4|nr:cobyrinic acid a,c-diamide synthase [Dyella sp. SG562]